MCSVDWLLLLEYIKVLLSWPPVAFAIAVLFLSKFRSSIDDFLKRLVAGKLFGQEFRAAPPSQQSGSAGAEEDRIAMAAEAATQPAVAVNEQVTEQLPPDLAGDPGAANAVTYVRNNPGQTVVEYKRLLMAYNAERLFMRIYGTQVALLEFLASRGENPAPMTLLAQFHDEHQKKSGTTEYLLRDYIHFLVGFGVVSVSGEENAYEYKVTQHGVEFLSYIKAQYPANWNQRAF